MKWILPLAIGMVLSAPVAAQDAPALPDYVTAAVADPARADDAKDDSRRHIAEIVAFSGVKPGDSVLELVPGSGYWSRVFSKIIGPEGTLYAAVPEPMQKYSEETMTLPDSHPNIRVLVQPAAALAVPTPVDVAFTAQNYHDYPDKFMGPTDPAILNRAVFAALKPGGTYLVIDHVAEAGSGLRDTETLHRIDPALVRQQVEAAGFEYVGESAVLRSPADDHTLKVFDDAIRGRTDQFVYKFRKPAAAQAAPDDAHAHHAGDTPDVKDMKNMEHGAPVTPAAPDAPTVPTPQED
ncbi:class I SAM-dependent methyltransferase [Cognatiluteimonas weifangensis]|uniref:class I SAM-dependent methyltransferase n=1 Tax=Cognatiluteimonas weifangensis TaxID=2303539 RepID=UPI0018F1DFE3|nr:class I SAM-dependent methyltransferase [Luteimonas weifangensis]